MVDFEISHWGWCGWGVESWQRGAGSNKGVLDVSGGCHPICDTTAVGWWREQGIDEGMPVCFESDCIHPVQLGGCLGNGVMSANLPVHK